jgi:hypothetical protein
MLGITRAMVIAGMRAEKPQMTASELRQGLFLRYDGDACSPEQRKTILAALADSWRRTAAAQDACAWSRGSRRRVVARVVVGHDAAPPREERPARGAVDAVMRRGTAY